MKNRRRSRVCTILLLIYPLSEGPPQGGLFRFQSVFFSKNFFKKFCCIFMRFFLLFLMRFLLFFSLFFRNFFLLKKSMAHIRRVCVISADGLS